MERKQKKLDTLIEQLNKLRIQHTDKVSINGCSLVFILGLQKSNQQNIVHTLRIRVYDLSDSLFDAL